MNWKTKQQNNQKSIHDYWVAFVVFCSISPYFLWKTFTHSDLNIVVLIELIFIISQLGLSILHRNTLILKERAKLISFLLLIGVLIYLFNGDGLDFYPARLIPIIAITVIISFNDKKVLRIYDCYMTLVALSLIMGIGIYLLNLLGVNIPYNELVAQNEGKTEVYQFYRQYFGAVQIDSLYADIMPRLCGMFDEPGVVGTFCALFLVSKRFDLKDWRTYIFLLGGLLSLSLAFFFLVILGLTLFSLNRDNKVLKIILIVLCVSMFVLTSYPALLDYILSRIGNGNIFSIMSGRMTNVNSYNQEMSKFWSTDLRHLLFGMGYNASMKNINMAGSYYYTMPIYDHGLLGTVLIVTWFVQLIKCIVNRCEFQSTKRNIFILTIVFVGSIAQRPYVLSIPYVVTLMGGALMMVDDEVI